MKVGIIGCGLIGYKRAESLPEGYLQAVADNVPEKAQQLAKRYPGVIATGDWKEVINDPTIDAVIVSTTNNWLSKITLAAVESGKHVIVEKPAAMHYSELDPVIKSADKHNVKVTVGYNLRFHPSFLKANALVKKGEIGELMYIRGRYGHGGRLGYEKEWRADPTISGGGELLDQGVHLIDLSRWFLGDFSEVNGKVHSFFWKMPVEDNGFVYLRTSNNKVAWLQVSCTEWKNLFSYEIFGETGKLQIDGIGGSYGVERLTLYKMLPEMGPPETTIWEFPFPDISWKTEFEEFERSIRINSKPIPDLRDARAAMKIVSDIYGEIKK